MKIEQWAMVTVAGDWANTPELRTQRLNGEVTGHSLHKDGTILTTSQIVGGRAGKVVTKSGSEYELGEPRPDYEKQFPGSRDRLLNSLPEV